MTEAAASRRTPRKRASKRALRIGAWLTGGLAFLAPWASIAASPRPATAAAPSRGRSTVVIRKITRRIVVREQPTQAPVQYVSAPSTSSSGSVASAPAPAPAPPPTTSTGSS